MAMMQPNCFLLGVFILFTPTTKGDQCLPNMENIAVYEKQTNIILNLATDPQNVQGTVTPTSDEFGYCTITDYGDKRNPSLTGLYDINQTGLVIKKATTIGNPISTAGLYVGQCANHTNRTGAKLLVVRKGPQCSCTPSDYASNVSCKVTFADSSIHPIYPSVTWKLNGAFLATYTLQRTRIDSYVFYAESTITVNSATHDNYTCELTFSAPTNIQFLYIATNAPAFSEYCSTPGCGETTAWTISTNEPPTTNPTPTTTTEPSTTECNCSQTTSCPSPDQKCSKARVCGSDGTNLTEVYNERVVKAELYARSDNCCPDDLVCGVVVTLRNDSRWLMHDPICDDNKCDLVVVDTSCMSSDWKLLAAKNVTISKVDNYLNAGIYASIGSGVNDCSESCKRVMNLP